MTEKFTEEEVIADILKYSTPPYREDSDISYQDIMRIAECSYHSAKTIGKEMVESGKYTKHKVRDPDTNHRIVVFRKKEV